jgi:hypothetical protein
MKLLLHTCCAPCLTGSRIPFEEEGFELTAYWYNPSIHPYTEHERRLHTFQRYLFLRPMDLIQEEGFEQYGFLKGQIQNALSSGDDADQENPQKMGTDQRKARCGFCYRKRMERTVLRAKEEGFEYFSTTMLLSKHQDHEGIRECCKEMQDESGVEFIYRDLRKQWKDSVRLSKELKLYRQPYCGCVFSEHERYTE